MIDVTVSSTVWDYLCLADIEFLSFLHQSNIFQHLLVYQIPWIHITLLCRTALLMRSLTMEDAKSSLPHCRSVLKKTGEIASSTVWAYLWLADIELLEAWSFKCATDKYPYSVGFHLRSFESNNNVIAKCTVITLSLLQLNLLIYVKGHKRTAKTQFHANHQLPHPVRQRQNQPLQYFLLLNEKPRRWKVAQSVHLKLVNWSVMMPSS